MDAPSTTTPYYNTDRAEHKPGVARASGSAGNGQNGGQTALLRAVHDDAQTRVLRGQCVLPVCLPISFLTLTLTTTTRRTDISRPFRAKLRRSFATVQDTPVRRYGGLKDQDRIFTNAYCRHDHGIKGAEVSFVLFLSCVLRSLASAESHHTRPANYVYRRNPLVSAHLNGLLNLLTSCFFQSRGDWHKTKDILLKGDSWDNSDYQGLWSAWPRRCWFPERIEVEFHEQAWLGEGSAVSTLLRSISSLSQPDPQSTLPRRQRRRG